MTAATEARDTPRTNAEFYYIPVAATTTCYQGTIACIDATGYATPGATSTTLKAVGRFEETLINAGSAGAVSINVRAGVYRWENSASTDTITIADVGNDCYIVDNQTVAKTSGTSTRSIAGKVVKVDEKGVWVLTGLLGVV